MKRLLAGLCLAFQLSLTFGADLSPKDVAALDAVIDQSNAAFFRSDFAGIADLSSERLLEAVGGKDKYVEAMQATMASIRARDVQVVSHHVEPPRAPVVADGFLVTVVKETTIMETHGRRFRTDGFTVAVRPAAGGTWKLIGGSGVVQNPGVIAMLYPGFPADYPFPPYATHPM